MVDSMFGTRRCLGGLSLALALGGCAQNDEPDWQFDRADMEGAVFGTWKGTFTPTDGQTVPLQLQVRAQDEPVRSLSCGSRNFSAGEATPGLGARCIESSSLKLSGTLTIDDGSEAEELDGSFYVIGTRFDSGDLDLFYRDSANHGLSAEFQKEAWISCGLRASEIKAGTCTLDERVE